MSVVRLSQRLRRELAYLSYPSREWVVPRFRAGRRVLDVLVVGAGQAGLAVAFGLKLERISNFRIVDRNARGQEGPWRRFARMRELRTFKDVTGIDLGVPNLTLRAWYEAKFGREAWDRIHKVSPQLWHDYLSWYRDVLELPVENDTEVTAIGPDDDLLFAELRRKSRSERVHARKIVLATGIDGSGAWRAPAIVANLPTEHYAHASDDIDFSRCVGKRVGILGAGASAFDNAAAALEAGAASVELCLRRAAIPRINPLFWTNFAGMLGHFAELSDLQRWRFMRRILEELPMPPPQESFWRCRSFKNFSFRTDCSWSSLSLAGGAVVVETNTDNLHFDFVVLATGVEFNLYARPELAPIAHQIALWRDRFKPPAGEESELLASYPYLGPAFEFMEREPGSAPYLGRLYGFNFGATLSLGITGAAITGMKYGVPRLLNGLTRDLFREDAEQYYRELLAYDVAELQTLESPFAWIDRLAAEALDPKSLIAQLHQAGLGAVLQGKRARHGSREAPRTAHPNANPRAKQQRQGSGKRPRVAN